MISESTELWTLPRTGGPVAWCGREIRSRDYIYELTRSDVREIDTALRGVLSQNLDLAKIIREQFPLGPFARSLEALARELESGIGFCLIRGIPIDRYSVREVGVILCGVGAHFGRLMPQNDRGEVLNHVRDAGPVSPGGEYVRGYRSCRGLPFHSDSCDITALLCIRTALSGGLSAIASSYAIHNAIVEARQGLGLGLLHTLYEPYHIDRYLEDPMRTTPYYSTPVFMRHCGRLFCRFNPGYVHSAQRYEETPRLTQQQAEAIEVFMQLCASDAFRLDMELKPGDLQLLNNNAIVHSRTAYNDATELAKKRHLLRLWLFTSEIDDLPVPMRDRYRDMESWQVNAHVQTCD